MMHQVPGKKVSTDRSWYGLLEYPNCLIEPANYSEKILARGYLSKRLDRGTNIEAAIASQLVNNIVCMLQVALNQSGGRNDDGLLWRISIKQVYQACCFLGIANHCEIPALDHFFGRRL